MNTYRATNRETHEVVEYESALPQPEHLGAGWRLEEVSEATVAPDVPDAVPSLDVARWRIDVGAFFDRFGGAKLPILASTDPIVEAMIKDASVRKYIALAERRDELAQMLALLQSRIEGVTLDPVAILDLEPTDDEVWNG